MNEIINVESMGLKNKQLTTQVRKISDAIKTIGRNKWKVADAIRTISEKELYKDDFEIDASCTIKNIREAVQIWKEDNLPKKKDTKAKKAEQEEQEEQEEQKEQIAGMSKGVFINAITKMDSETFSSMIDYLKDGGYLGE